MDKTVADSI